MQILSPHTIEKIYNAAADNAFPPAVQPLAEAIAVDMLGAGYAHMSQAVVGNNIELELSVFGLLTKLQLIADATAKNPAHQPSAEDMDHLKTWFEKIRTQIPEGRQHLCLMESQRVTLPSAAPR